MSEPSSGWLKSEDWWSVWIGLIIFLLSLGMIAGADLLGWGAQLKVWLTPTPAVKPVSAAYNDLPGYLSILLTYVFLLIVMSFRAKFCMPLNFIGFCKFSKKN